ncbi:protein NDUFAF4 homolog [Schistocerca gregaria]|uniref:NDUFAF4 n=1 Tax=Schistocerca gregaria TaxID=7010 RepID=A0A8E5NIW8_SCHGR|nr:protein NDUFAF4 homolog [Schistocerca gregaria]QVD39171.1 NDUFAF4 [Schistocerca gregaria]
MGVVLSATRRALNRFNVENRAMKEISKEKPTPAPRHPSMSLAIEKMAKENTDVLNDELTKNTALDSRLKQVFVTSKDTQPEVSESTRPLPQSRKAVESPEFGFEEPAMIPRGRFSLRQALQFITLHQENPKEKTPALLAKEYNLDPVIMEKILTYYKTFEVYIPETKGKSRGNALAEPVKSPQTELQAGKT